MDLMETYSEENLRKDVVNGARSVFQKGLVDVGEGNVSARIPKEEHLFITPTLNQYQTMTVDDVVHLRFDGTQINHGKQASTEYRLHVAVYEAHTKARCVIHTHSPYATMFSIVKKRIPVVMEAMVLFLGGAINVSKFAPAHTDYIGRNVVDALGGKNAVIMANHGVLVCGRTMEQAVRTADLVEKMAKIYWGASQIKEPKVISDGAFVALEREFISDLSTK